MRKPTVLVVDDEAHIRRVAATALEADGYLVEQAIDGEDALARLQTSRPDVLLVDLRMPKLDGIGLLRRLSGIAQPPVVVVMSAYAEVTDVKTVMSLGAIDFLEKPFGLADLRRAIAQALEVEPSKAPTNFAEHLQGMRRHVRLRRFDLAEIDVRASLALAKGCEQRAEAFFFLGVLLELKEQPALARDAYAAALVERPVLLAAKRRVDAIDARTGHRRPRA